MYAKKTYNFHTCSNYFFSLSLTTFAATSSSLCLSEPQLIESDSNCDYYLNENKLLKIQKISEGSANHPNISLVQSYNQLYEVTKTILLILGIQIA